MPTLDELNERFRHDRFATVVAGARILEAQPSRALCAMPLTPQHMNANNTPMGGAIFTLADFAFAVASNADQPPTVSLSSQISFLGVAKGTKLIAEARCEKQGRSTCTYLIHLFDDLDTPVALVTVTGFIKS